MTPMQYTTFGRTGLRLSRVGLGAGGPSRLGAKRGATQDEIERLIGTALDLGVNVIDTARGYGTEAAIGAALQALGAGDVIVATKAVVHPGRDDPATLAAEVEASLRDLRRDRLDLFQFHAVRPPDYEALVDAWLPAAESLREQGKVRFIGLTENPATDHGQAVAAPAAESGLWDSLMVQYGVFDQVAAVRTLPAARSQGTGVFCMSAARAALVSEEMLASVLARLDGISPDDLRFLLGGDTRTWADLAFRFAAAREGIDVVVVGTGSAEHFAQSAAAVLAPPLPADQVAWLEGRFGQTDGRLLWKGDE